MREESVSVGMLSSNTIHFNIFAEIKALLSQFILSKGGREKNYWTHAPTKNILSRFSHTLYFSDFIFSLILIFQSPPISLFDTYTHEHQHLLPNIFGLSSLLCRFLLMETICALFSFYSMRFIRNNQRQKKNGTNNTVKHFSIGIISTIDAIDKTRLENSMNNREFMHKFCVCIFGLLRISELIWNKIVLSIDELHAL